MRMAAGAALGLLCAHRSSRTVTATPSGSHSFVNWTRTGRWQHVGELHIHDAQCKCHTDSTFQNKQQFMDRSKASGEVMDGSPLSPSKARQCTDREALKSFVQNEGHKT